MRRNRVSDERQRRPEALGSQIQHNRPRPRECFIDYIQRGDEKPGEPNRGQQATGRCGQPECRAQVSSAYPRYAQFFKNVIF